MAQPALVAFDHTDSFECQIHRLRGQYLQAFEAHSTIERKKRNLLARHQSALQALEAGRANRAKMITSEQLPALRIQYEMVQNETILLTQLGTILQANGDTRGFQRQLQHDLQDLKNAVKCHSIEQLLAADENINSIRWPMEHPLILAAAQAVMLLLDAEFVDLKDWRQFITDNVLQALRTFDYDSVDSAKLANLRRVLDFDVAQLQRVSNCFGTLAAWLKHIILYARCAIPIRVCLLAARSKPLTEVLEQLHSGHHRMASLSSIITTSEATLAQIEVDYQTEREAEVAKFNTIWSAVGKAEASLRSYLDSVHHKVRSILPHFMVALEDATNTRVWFRTAQPSNKSINLHTVRMTFERTAMGSHLAAAGYNFLRRNRPVQATMECCVSVKACLLRDRGYRMLKMRWPPVIPESELATTPWDDLVPHLLVRRNDAPSPAYWRLHDFLFTSVSESNSSACQTEPSSSSSSISSSSVATIPSSPGSTPCTISAEGSHPGIAATAFGPKSPIGWVNEPDALGCTVLQAITNEGQDTDQAPALHWLVRHGADVLVRDWRGTTPLHIAAAHGKRRFVQELLQHMEVYQTDQHQCEKEDGEAGGTHTWPQGLPSDFTTLSGLPDDAEDCQDTSMTQRTGACCPSPCNGPCVLCYPLHTSHGPCVPGNQPMGVHVALRMLDGAGRTPLHCALAHATRPSVVEVAEALLDRQACVACLDNHATSVLQLACATAPVPLLQRLLHLGALDAVLAWQQRDDRPCPKHHLVIHLLQTVIQRGDVAVAEVLIDALLASEQQVPLPLPPGAAHAASTGWGLSAASPCHSLLDVSFHAGRGGPIQLACQLGHVAMLQLLLRKGFNPVLYQGYQQPFAVEEAVVHAPVSIVHALLTDARVVERSRTSNAWRSSEPAAPSRFGTSNQWLYEGLRVNMADDWSRPLRLLHLAIEHDRLQVIRKLLELQTFSGFVVNYRYTIDNQQRSVARKASVWWANALAVAIEHIRPAALQLLLSAQPLALHRPCLYRKAQTVLAFSPLLLATYVGHAPTVKLLLNAGASVSDCPAVIKYSSILQSLQYCPSISMLNGRAPVRETSLAIRLPDDLLTTVLGYLDARTLQSVATVCSKWYMFSCENSLWIALGKQTLHAFRKYIECWASGVMPIVGEDEAAVALEMDETQDGPVPYTRNYKNLFAYFRLHHPDGKFWNYAYQYATTPALLLESRLGQTVAGYKAYHYGGLLATTFLYDFIHFKDDYSLRIWNELPLKTLPRNKFELHHRRLKIVELLLEYPECQQHVNSLFVDDSVGPDRLKVVSPLVALLQCPGRSEPCVMRLLDLKADVLLGVGVRSGSAESCIRLPLPTGKYSSQALEPFLRCPEEPATGVWQLDGDGIYELCIRSEDPAFRMFDWIVYPFEAALDWGNAAVFSRLFPPSFQALSRVGSCSEGGMRVKCNLLLSQAARLGHTAIFRYLLDFFAAHGRLSSALFQEVLPAAIKGGACDIISLCCGWLPDSLEGLTAVGYLHSAARLARQAAFSLLYNRIYMALDDRQRRDILATCCVYGRAESAHILIDSLLGPRVDTGPLTIAAAMGHVDIIASWVKKFGAEDLFRAGESHLGPPPTDPPEEHAATEEDSELSFSGWMVFGLMTFFPKRRSQWPHLNTLAPVHYLATTKVRWAVSMVLAAIHTAEGDITPLWSSPSLDIPIFPPVALPLSHPAASPFVPTLLSYTSASLLPRDVKSDLALTLAFSRRPAWLKHRPYAVIVLVPIHGGHRPVSLVGSVLMPPEGQQRAKALVSEPPSEGSVVSSSDDQGFPPVSSELERTRQDIIKLQCRLRDIDNSMRDHESALTRPCSETVLQDSDAEAVDDTLCQVQHSCPALEPTFLGFDPLYGEDVVLQDGYATPHDLGPDEIELSVGLGSPARCTPEPSPEPEEDGIGSTGLAESTDSDVDDMGFLLHWYSSAMTEIYAHECYRRVAVLVLPAELCDTTLHDSHQSGEKTQGQSTSSADSISGSAAATGWLERLHSKPPSSVLIETIQAALLSDRIDHRPLNTVVQSTDGTIVGLWDGQQLLQGSDVLVIRSATPVETSRLSNVDLHTIVTKLHYDMDRLCTHSRDDLTSPPSVESSHPLTSPLG